jgi:CrcB protein
VWFTFRAADAELLPMPTAPPSRLVLPLIFAGGGLGSAARWGLEAAFASPPGTFPWCTMAINASGSLLLGALLAGLGAPARVTPARRLTRACLGTGVLGGFTTYSAFALEAVELIAAGRAWLAAAYVAASVGVGVAAALAGGAAVRATQRRRP